MNNPTGFRSWSTIPLSHHPDENGDLTVLADRGIPFQTRRVFSVHGKNGDLRGQHAHRTCSQLLACVSGEIEVTLRNHTDTASVTLRPGGYALLIPPMIWGSQKFLKDTNIMVVLADSYYDESEYIREWEEFVKLSTGNAGA